MESANTANTIDQMISHWGISESVEGDTWQLHIPPPTLAELHRGYFISLPLLATGIIGAVIAAVGFHRGNTEGIDNGIIVGAEFGFTGLFISLLAMERLQRRIYFQVSPSELQVARIVHGKPIVFGHWKRTSMGDIHLNRSNGKLRLCRKGDDDPFEMYLTSRPELNQWILQRLIDQLQHAPEISTAHSMGPTKTPPHATSNRQRNMLIATALLITVLGFAAFFTPIGMFALYILILAGIPAGLAFGTQKKDFWV